MFKLAAAALVLAALAFGGFRLLANDEAPSPARETASAARAVAGAIERAVDETKARAEEPAWVKAVNASCRKDKRALDALGQPRTLDDLVPYLRGVLAIAERSERRFRTIEVPPDTRRKLDRLNGEAMRLLRGTLRAAERRDTAAVLEHAEAAIAFGHRINPYVRRLGLHDCALPPSGLPT